MRKQDYAAMKQEVTFIPEGCVFANGLMGYIANNRSKLTKSELVAIIMELDYLLQVKSNDSKSVNEIYESLFNPNESYLEEKLTQ